VRPRTDAYWAPAYLRLASPQNPPESTMIMKSKAALCTVLAASLFAGQFAFAQGDAPGANRNRYEQNQRGNDRDRREDTRQNNNYDGRGYDQRVDHRNNRAHGDHHDRGERGAGPSHSYYRGGHLPPQYRTRQYVVEDWRGHRLSAPPRGYHWVQSGSDYILVAIATGVILNLLLNN
jgi:Ni/Co efflux regulator RcnB